MKVKVKSLSRIQPSATPWTAAFQAPPPPIGSGLVFMEALTYLERASDQCSSIAVSMLARNNDQILENHHDYLREIHLSNDVSYLSERERRRDQYVKPLKEIQ